MSDDAKVVITNDNGIKNQWASGLFYRQDGLKRVLIPRRLFMVAGFVFAVLTVGVVIQGTPDAIDGGQTNPRITSPDGLGMQTLNNIPVLVAQGTPTEVKQTPLRNPPRDTVPISEKKSGLTGPLLIRRPRPGRIPPGSFIRAILLSGASNGPVRAEVTEGLSIQGEPFIEQGATLVGNGQSGEERLTIRFSQLVHRDGALESIDGLAWPVTLETRSQASEPEFGDRK